LYSSRARRWFDVIAKNAVAQVKAHMVFIGRPDVQRLRGAAHRGEAALFFSLTDYTTDAYTFANEANVALFRFADYSGSVEPKNDAAKKLARERSQPSPRPKTRTKRVSQRTYKPATYDEAIQKGLQYRLNKAFAEAPKSAGPGFYRTADGDVAWWSGSRWLDPVSAVQLDRLWVEVPPAGHPVDDPRNR
jgi:hypothetical protein